MHGFICSPNIYEYKGWTFEKGPSIGVWPLRKDGEPRKSVSEKFWKVYEEWEDLSEEEKDACHVGGGCQRF